MRCKTPYLFYIGYFNTWETEVNRKIALFAIKNAKEEMFDDCIRFNGCGCKDRV